MNALCPSSLSINPGFAFPLRESPAWFFSPERDVYGSQVQAHFLIQSTGKPQAGAPAPGHQEGSWQCVGPRALSCFDGHPRDC